MCMESRIYLCINRISRKWNDALLLFLQTQHLVISLESYGYFNLAEETISGFSQHTLQSFTVERLRALLRQSGLSTKGKKVRETMLNLLILIEFAEFLFEIRIASASFDFLLHLYWIQKNFIAYHKILQICFINLMFLQMLSAAFLNLQSGISNVSTERTCCMAC